MKIKKGNGLYVTILFLLLSLTANGLLIYKYFYDFLPKYENLETKNKELSSKTYENISCKTKIYSKSKNKTYCLDNLKESEALTICSDSITKTLQGAASTIKSLSELEKVRTLFMSTCMEGYGFRY